MSHVWPPSTIRELIALAETDGTAKATLADAEAARLFRFAVYSFRRTHNLGGGLSVTLDNNEVILAKREIPTITVSSPSLTSGDNL